MHSVLLRQVLLAVRFNMLDELLQHKTLKEVIDLTEMMADAGENAIAAMLFRRTIIDSPHKTRAQKRAGTAKQHKRTQQPWFPLIIAGKLIEKTQYQCDYVAVCLAFIAKAVPGILHSVYQKQITDGTRQKIGMKPEELYCFVKFHQNPNIVKRIGGTVYVVGTYASWDVNKKYIQYVCHEAGLSYVEQSS